MIAKRAHRRKDSPSSFSTLVAYITRDGKAAQKDGIEYSRVTHCGFDTVDLAVREIEATQARNTRSKIDKTYHRSANKLFEEFKETVLGTACLGARVFLCDIRTSGGRND